MKHDTSETIMANAQKAASMLKSVGNADRLLVLCHLADGRKSASELQRLVSSSHSAVSQHLARLRDDRIINSRREGRTLYYEICDEPTRQILDVLCNIYSKTELGAA